MINHRPHNLLLMPIATFEAVMHRCHPKIAERIAQRLSCLRADLDVERASQISEPQSKTRKN